MKTDIKYQICRSCVMDTSDPNITFDINGSCNHCESYKQQNVIDEEEKAVFLNQLVDIKNIDSTYNCLIGVSGGLDSTYLLIHAVKDLGLRPLAVHIDNGWNTGLANQNIANLCDGLNVDLVTEVLDWDEFREMQLAILRSGTPDLEAPTDLFINYMMRRVAKKFGIKYIFSGTNPQTEGVMGSNWSYGQRDPIYLGGLFRQFIGKAPRRLPFKNWYVAIFEQLGSDINIVRPLKFVPYGKKIAVTRCQNEVGWIEYERKHGESFITKFYQSYFLPRRFGFDKRNAHYSALILNGDISRDEALHSLESSQLTTVELEAEIDFFVRKLQISREEFDRFMKSPLKFHEDYRTLKDTVLFRLGKFLKRSIHSDTKLYHFVKRLILN